MVTTAAAAIFLPLLGAFACVWISRKSSAVSLAVSRLILAAGLAATVLVSLHLGAWNLRDLSASLTLNTGVGAPPLSIDLEITAWSALAAVVIYVLAFLIIGRLSRRNSKTQILMLALVTASLGLLFSTDLFNSFVFLEIGSIVTVGLAAACRRRSRWEVAVKVAMVSGIVTILYLLAVAAVYRFTGELRLEALAGLSGGPAILVSALLLTVIITEIKAFPLSGWGLDLYTGAGAGFAAAYAGTWSLAVLLWSARVLPLLPLPDISLLVWAGAGGLVLGQLAGYRSSSPGRMMGYSTAAYGSLLLILAGIFTGEEYLLITLVLLVTGGLAKFSVFSMNCSTEGKGWRNVRGILLLIPVLSLIGIPPFPVFWVKLSMLAKLAPSPLLMGMVMAGLLLEALYLLRMWTERNPAAKISRRMLPSAVSTLVILFLSAWLLKDSFRLMDLSGGILNSRVLETLFMVIFGAGTLLTLPGVFNRTGGERSYWFWMLISGAALFLLPMAGNGLTFYVLWEISAFAAVVAVSRGNNSRSSFWFAAFAAASGFLLLASVVLGHGTFATAAAPAILASAAALLKMGQMGAHLWNVRAYSSAPSTMPAFLAGTSSKAAVLLLAVAAMGAGGMPWGRLLGWIGTATALALAVKAALSSDYKKVLAYASVSQMGYILAGIGLASVMGWTAAFYHTFHHFLFKTVLFLGAAGVIYRTGTSSYNKLGGLIRRMPMTFAFTLVCVIAFAGVPPLAGFGGKWLLYNGLIQAGWLPMALVAMFASVVAFLYAFRLLYAVFLGQLSPRYSNVREAPLTLLIPQGILTAGVMALSFRPTFFLNLLVPGIRSAGGLASDSPVITGTEVTTVLGNWNAWWVGLMVMALFGFAFVFYWLSGRRPKHVGQLDIGYAGELPPSPSAAHYAGIFYRPYRRALSFLPPIHAGKVFHGITGIVRSSGDVIRSIFTGDARTYLAHSLIVTVLLILWLRGGLP